MNDLQRSTAFRPFTTLSPVQFPVALNSSLEPISLSNFSDSSACEFSKFEFIAYFVVQPIICLVGALLNLISFTIFCRGKQFAGNPTYKLMMVLALFDALTLLLTLPSSFIRCKAYLSICGSKLFKKFRMGAFVLQLFGMYPLINICEGVSVSITVLLSIERYISIKYHYIIKAYFSPTNVRKLVLVLISACFIINLPLVFVQFPKPIYANVTVYPMNGSQIIANSTPTYQDGELKSITGKLTEFGKSKIYPVYTWTRIIIYNFLPLIFLAVINAFLIYIVRTSGHFRKQSSQTRSAEKRLKGQRNLTILLVTVIFLFLTGQIPLAFANVAVFAKVTGCKSLSKPNCCIFYSRYRVVVNSISLITYGANFFVYLALNKHFRSEICRVCQCFKIRSQNGAANTVLAGEQAEMIRKNRDKNLTVITDGNGEIEANNANHSSVES